MKLYQNNRAPNPRRARIFMAEKNVDFSPIEIVEMDLAAGDNLTEEFRQINPMRGVPVLELDDGSCIAESMAISRYFEATVPEPPLMGRGAREQAVIEMWNRRMEMNLLYPVAMAFRHTTGHFSDREPVCAEYGQICLNRSREMFGFLNNRLANSEYVAGEAFSVADISALCAVDFARVIKLRISDEQPHLKRWHDAVSARPSAGA